MAPVNVVYIGPSADGVEIAETGQHAPQGKPIEVETEVAERLLQQEDTFARPNTNAAPDVARQVKSPRKSGTQKDDD